MAKRGNRNYARGRAREEELVRLLKERARAVGTDSEYTIERAPISGQSSKNRKDAGWDIRITHNETSESITISVKTGKSVPVGVYRIADQGHEKIYATLIDGSCEWCAQVSPQWFRKAKGQCDRLAVKRPNKPWVFLEEVKNDKTH